MTGLTSLTLDAAYNARNTHRWLVNFTNFVRSCVTRFRMLRYLAIDITLASSGTEILASGSRSFEKIFRDISRHLLVLGAMSNISDLSVGPEIRSTRFQARWKTTKGASFTWTDETYFRSIPWANIGIVYQHLTGYHRYAFWRTYATTSSGLMVRRLTHVCRLNDLCPCASVQPPPYRCHHPNPHPSGFSCGVAPNGLDSIDRYTFTKAGMPDWTRFEKHMMQYRDPCGRAATV
jgi:hypothetical protein